MYVLHNTVQMLQRIVEIDFIKRRVVQCMRKDIQVMDDISRTATVEVAANRTGSFLVSATEIEHR